jgi:hypothetical protein
MAIACDSQPSSIPMVLGLAPSFDDVTGRDSECSLSRIKEKCRTIPSAHVSVHITFSPSEGGAKRNHQFKLVLTELALYERPALFNGQLLF